MAPFSSHNTTKVPHPLTTTFQKLSTEEAFKSFLSLSRTTHTVDLLEVKKVQLSNKWIDQVLKDSESNPARFQLEIPEEAKPADGDDKLVEGTSYKFKLVEKIDVLFGLKKQYVTIFGTQTVVEDRKLHLYDSVANGGLVKVLKIRRFESAGTGEGEGEGKGETLITEQIRGDTMWLLKSYTERECRSAHKDHMARYHELDS